MQNQIRIVIPEDKFVVLLVLISAMCGDASSLSSSIVSFVIMVSSSIDGDKFASVYVKKGKILRFHKASVIL